MKKLYLIGIIIISLFLCGMKKFISPELQFPVSCQIDENCRIISSDETGTKITVESLPDDEKGVPVLAAQDGTVILVHEDNEDKTFSGNSVIIEHNDGWKTIYTHLKNGSISVKKGDFVKKGAQIAQLGMSGKAENPCLYFALAKEDKFFAPTWESSKKEKSEPKEAVIAGMGASVGIPDFQSIKQDSNKSVELFNDAPSISLWVYGFNFKKGDFIKFSLKNPDNENIFDKLTQVSEDFDETVFTAVKTKEAKIWQVGKYTAKVEFIRTNAGIAKEYVFSFNIKEPENFIDEEKLKQEEEKELEEIKTLRRKRLFIYKRLYDEGKLPETVPENVKEILDKLPSTLPDEE